MPLQKLHVFILKCKYLKNHVLFRKSDKTTYVPQEGSGRFLYAKNASNPCQAFWADHSIRGRNTQPR